MNYLSIFTDKTTRERFFRGFDLIKEGFEELRSVLMPSEAAATSVRPKVDVQG